jgi:dTDP-4-amino-4,6-dideoxygalactose transaminase
VPNFSFIASATAPLDRRFGVAFVDVDRGTLLLDRFKRLEERQAVRMRNFELLRSLMKDIACVEPVALHPGVRAHGMYMFAMRYRPDHCGGLSIDQFIDLVQAEGAPIYRAFASTMSDQPAVQHLMRKRPEYFRRLPTPIADRAAEETVYIAHGVFLGTAADMEDIAAALRKVERYCLERGSRRFARKAA